MNSLRRQAAKVAAFLSLLVISLAAWGDSPAETALMPGKVIEGHAKYEQECSKCHVRFDKAGQSRLCMECHKDVASDVRGKSGFHGKQRDKKECRSCHTDHEGRSARIVLFDKERFDHSMSDFVLRAGHAGSKVECKACHTSGKKYRDAPNDCNSCHLKDDVHKGGLGTSCADCHTERNWKEAKFDHGTTKFALTGKHSPVACRDCHSTQDFKGAKKECASCHRQDDNEKGHRGRFGPKCESCHTDRSWKEDTFNHEKDTRFSLRGKHRNTKCESCHKTTLFSEKTPTRCFACHQKDDVHKTSQGEKCESCHNESNWKVSNFDHDKTQFGLIDKHKTTECEACHGRDRSYLKKLPIACNGCHAKDDAHKGRYSEKCENCHNAKDWKKILFNHALDTRYVLRGRHETTKCAECHKGTMYKEQILIDCASCHRKDDKHKGQLGARCEDCHNEKDWKSAPFDHNRSRFPLIGAHIKTKCEACHKSPQFRDAPHDCMSCHSKEDVHKKRLGISCEACHNARSWKSWDFDHDRRTKFRLDGAHRKANCYACHKRPLGDKEKAVLPKTCMACHVSEDVHNGSFGPACDRCHGTSDWRDIRPGGRLTGSQ